MHGLSICLCQEYISYILHMPSMLNVFIKEYDGSLEQTVAPGQRKYKAHLS